jgi:hypothetical protein
MASFVNRSLLTEAADPDGRRLRGLLSAAIQNAGINDSFDDSLIQEDM